MMQKLRSSHINSDPSRASVPDSTAATNRNLRSADVIGLAAARAIHRPQTPGHWMTQANTVETREHASQRFFLQDEPLLRFRDFDAGP
jgi:hypothetical protein